MYGINFWVFRLNDSIYLFLQQQILKKIATNFHFHKRLNRSIANLEVEHAICFEFEL
jgi:hypothetical protein